MNSALKTGETSLVRRPVDRRRRYTVPSSRLLEAVPTVGEFDVGAAKLIRYRL